MCRWVVPDGVKRSVVEVSESKLLLEDVCLVFEKDSRREAVLRVREYEDGEDGEADSLFEKGCMELEAMFCGRDCVLK